MSDLDAFMDHLGEVSKLIADRDKAKAAARVRKADTLADAIGNAIEADGQAVVFGTAESLAKLRRLEGPHVRLVEEPFAPPGDVYVMRGQISKAFEMQPPLLLEPPEQTWEIRTLWMKLDAPLIHRPFISVDWAYAPAPRRPLSRREQHRADVRTGLAARRARMQRRS